MVWRYCRRRLWVKVVWWTIGLSALFLIAWTYRSWVIHGINFLSSPEYRECVNRRKVYSAEMARNEYKKPHQELFVTMAYHGRLGNWMFQYASLLGIAKVNGFTPYFPQWHSLSFSFGLTKVSPNDADCLTVIHDPKPMSYVESLNRLPKSNITLDGYFQSWKYFHTIEDQIRREFTFSKDVQRLFRKSFENYVGRHVRAGREIISIHARRGDMVTPAARRLGFKSAPAEYFSNAMRYMMKKHPYSAFLVVSDDVEWCRNNIRTVRIKYYNHRRSGGEEGERSNRDDTGRFLDNELKKSQVGRIFVVNERDGSEEVLDMSVKNIDKLIESGSKSQHDGASIEKSDDNNDDDDSNSDNDYVYLKSPPIVIAPRGNSITDMALLTLANHSIMSVGTFGWWGAWLAGGDVVYYQDWPEKDHKVYYEWTQEDFYPPHWVAVSRGSTVVVEAVVRVACCCCWFVLRLWW